MAAGLPEGPAVPPPPRGNLAQSLGGSWRRIALLILAITIHNIPGEVLPPERSSHLPEGKVTPSAPLLGWNSRDVGPFLTGVGDRMQIFLGFICNLRYCCGEHLLQARDVSGSA